MEKLVGIVLNFVLFFSLVNGFDSQVIQRKIDFLKVDISSLLTKWSDKMDTIETYNEYTSCWRNASVTGKYMNTKHLIDALDKMKTKAEIELIFYRRIINKLTEIFPREILIVNRRDPDEPYQAEEMKLTLSESLEPFTHFLGPIPDFSQFSLSPQRIPTPCPDDVLETRKFVLTSRMESCSFYDSCNYGYFTVTPNGNIVTIQEKIIEVFAVNGTRLKTFKSDLPGIYRDGITFWKENKILVVYGDENTGKIYVIDLVSETTELYLEAWPYHYSGGISVFDDVIFICSGHGLLFRMSIDHVESRGRMYQYEPSFYDKVFIYESGPGSKYGLLKGMLFRHRYVLMNSTGEIICSPNVDQYPTFMAVAAVGKYFFVISKYHYQGFQAYDFNCNPLGDPVRFEPSDNQHIMGMNILNNTLIVSTSDRDHNKKIVFYTFE